MKNSEKWIVRLLSDASGTPSTRLHIAWLLTGLLFFYIIYQTLKAFDIQVDLVWALIAGVATMSGLSIVDKSALKDKVDVKDKIESFRDKLNSHKK